MNLVTANVLRRVFFIHFNGEVGTAFTCEHEGSQYLVTARHLFRSDPNSTPKAVLVNSGDTVTINVFRNNNFANVALDLRVYFHQDLEIDVAVLPLATDLSPRTNLIFDSDEIPVSQTGFFLGFPLNLMGAGHQANNGYPIPLVKSLTLSALYHDLNGNRMILIDAINNRGFSGGPVVFFHQGALRVAAITKGYFRSTQNVEVPQNVQAPQGIQEVPQNVVSQTLTVFENSGIGIAYDIIYAFEIIDAI